MRMSASKMKKWMECPLSAHFHYDLHLPSRQNAKASFGVCIHHALDLYNQTGNLDLAIDDFRKNWYAPEKLGVAPDHWPKMTDYAGLRDRGVEILRVFHENTKWDKREVIATEHPFLVPFGRHQLTGFVDLVEIRRSGKGKNLLRIVDFKTSSKKPTKAALMLDIQFSIYIYASMQKEFWTGYPGEPDFPGLPNGEFQYESLKDMPRRAIWFHLWTQQELDAGDRGDDDFMRLYRLAHEIEKADAAQIHVPRIGDACGLCDHQKACGIEIPASVVEEETAWL